MPGPFTTAEASARGLGRGALRGPRVRREFYGVYSRAEAASTERERVRAALRVLPEGTAADSTTALRLHGAGVAVAEPLRFVTTHPHQVRRPGLGVRRVEALEAVLVDGLRALCPADAFVAAARDVDLVELVAAGDSLVRLAATTTAELRSAALSARGRGCRLARRAAGLVRDRVDSVQETRLRLAIVLAGLPEPEVNAMVLARGRPVGRVDLLLWAYRTVIEYEGDQHRTDRPQWNRDIWRQEQLVADGNRLVRVTGERMRSPRAVVVAVHEAMVEGGYRGPEPVFDAEWRRLFATAR